MKHKHSEVIKAWADGKIVEGQSPSTDLWHDAPPITEMDEYFLTPHPLHPEYDWWVWRIKQYQSS